jgi:hypothetical protein
VLRVRPHRQVGYWDRTPSGEKSFVVTYRGLRIALFFTRTYARVLRPRMADLAESALPSDTHLRRAADQFEAAIDEYVARAKLT